LTVTSLPSWFQKSGAGRHVEVGAGFKVDWARNCQSGQRLAAKWKRKQSDSNEEVVDGHRLVARLVSGSDFEAECFDLAPLFALAEKANRQYTKGNKREEGIGSSGATSKVRFPAVCSSERPATGERTLPRRDTRFLRPPVRDDFVMLARWYDCPG
jgi:hypothetical protein